MRSLAIILCGALAVNAPAQTEPATPRQPPGATPLPSDLASRLWTAYGAKGSNYEPRTQHLRADGSAVYVNRLILEVSFAKTRSAQGIIDASR